MNLKKISGLCISLTWIASFGSASAQAMPLASEADRAAFLAGSNANEQLTDYDFRGIVALSNCSASLVKTSMSKSTDHALVLTNGHCYEGGFTAPGKIVSHVASTRTMQLYIEADPNGRKVTLHATEVIYSTMTGSDMTIYRLKETYGDIDSRYHVSPFLISEKHPTAQESIFLVSGYFSTASQCALEAFIPELREGDWRFQDSIRYGSGCEAIHGTSGSPLIDATSREIVGINNTHNDQGQRCTVNNPCEVDANGAVTVRPDASYGQETYWITTCLNTQGEIDLQHEGCLLFKGQ